MQTYTKSFCMSIYLLDTTLVDSSMRFMISFSSLGPRSAGTVIDGYLGGKHQITPPAA
jgi:hypothetical protein